MLFNGPPRFLSSSTEMSYLHVSLVHSAWTSSGLPEAAGCFPRVSSHASRGEEEACTPGSHRVPLSRGEAPGSPPEALGRLRAAGSCSPLRVLKADTGERAEQARSRAATLSRGRGSCSPASLKLSPSPPNSFSLPARLPHVSLTLRREPPPPQP